jgi:hypothetical protein
MTKTSLPVRIQVNSLDGAIKAAVNSTVTGLTFIYVKDAAVQSKPLVGYDALYFPLVKGPQSRWCPRAESDMKVLSDKAAALAKVDPKAMIVFCYRTKRHSAYATHPVGSIETINRIMLENMATQKIADDAILANSKNSPAPVEKSDIINGKTAPAGDDNDPLAAIEF